MYAPHFLGVSLVALLEAPVAEASSRLFVSLADATGLSAEVLQVLKEEVEEIYSPAGVRIQWVPESLAELPANAARVYVLERLPANLETRLRTFGGKAAMAAAFVAKGERADRTIYVSRSAVYANASRGRALTGEELATALGRVVAHELAHRYISLDHRHKGILKESLLPDDLTGSRTWMRFTEEQLECLHRSAATLFGAGSEPIRTPHPPR